MYMVPNFCVLSWLENRLIRRRPQKLGKSTLKFKLAAAGGGQRRKPFKLPAAKDSSSWLGALYSFT